ncbi:hypothetical protein ACFL40_02295 [candidate division KSB1 bacterium]
MSSAVKNTIILFIMLLIIVFIGIFRVHIYSKEKLKEIEKINNEKRLEIKNIADKAANYNNAVQALKNIENKWKTREKVLQRDEQSGKTLLFLSNIASETNSTVKFDFAFLENTVKEGYRFSKYNITGEGPYSRVYGFIDKIEKAKNLYKIKLLNMQGKEGTSEKTGRPVTVINFSFILEAYSAFEDDDVDSEAMISYTYKKPLVNPFNPLVKKNIPPNTKGLIEVENARLEAISYDMILIRDSKGRFTSLKTGDEVYLGYLTKINPEKSEAVFTLNKGGLIEKVILKIFIKN